MFEESHFICEIDIFFKKILVKDYLIINLKYLKEAVMQNTIIIKIKGNKKIDPFILKSLTSESQYQITRIDDGKWFTFGMKQLCPEIEQWSVQRLYLYKNQHRRIIKQLSSVKLFTCLNGVYLQKNMLESIQDLTYINLENLSYLYLSSNNISRIRSFRKYNCKYLRDFQIQDNRIVETPEFFQFYNEYLKKMRIDCLGNQLPWKWSSGQKMKWETKGLEDVGRAVSYESLNIGRNYMRPRIDFKDLQARMRKKYPKIQIWAMK